MIMVLLSLLVFIAIVLYKSKEMFLEDTAWFVHL